MPISVVAAVLWDAPHSASGAASRPRATTAVARPLARWSHQSERPARLAPSFNPGLDLHQRGGTGLLGGAERAEREPVPKEIGQEFLGARLRQQLVVAQVDSGGLCARPILHHIRHGGRKGGLGAGVASGTDLVFTAMFGHGEGQHREVKDLASLIVCGGGCLPILPATPALRDGVRLDLIGLVVQA